MAASNSADVVEHQAWLGHLFAEDRSGEDCTCDLILTSEGKEFLVHKNVVMLVSKFFKKMFTIEMKEKYEGVVEVKQIPHQRLSNIIEFIYSGRISITEENVTEILDDAEYTQMEADNCLKIRAYAQRYNLEEVQDKTNQVIKEHLEAIVKQEDFLQLDVDNLSTVLKQRSQVHEEAVFTGILDWVNHNPLQREDLFVHFFCQLDLTSMTSAFLAKLHTENRVKNNLVCANKLVDILLEVKSESMKCKIVLIDGKNSETECVTYDVLTKQPSHLPKLSYHRCRPTSTKFGSKVFVFGGAENMKGRNPHKSCEMLNFNEQVKWVDMPDMTEARGACACGFIGNCIYVTGGFQNGALSSCEKFDLLGNKWMAINPMLQKRYGHATVVCDGSVYCIGGHDGNTCLASCERYDMNTEKWNEIAPLHKKRNYVAGVVLDNTIYAIGGVGFGSTVERYWPNSNTWEYVASCQIGRSSCSACVIGNKIFVVGDATKSVEVYDPTTDVWTASFELVKPVTAATVVAI